MSVDLTLGAAFPRSGLAAEVGIVVKANIKELLVDALHDPIGHAYAVASGRSNFREVFGRHMGAFFGKNRAQCDHFADLCWAFLETQWRTRYTMSATKFLDGYSPVSPPTAQEIDDAWELEIAGDERAMAQHYEGSARIRTGADMGAKRFD